MGSRKDDVLHELARKEYNDRQQSTSRRSLIRGGVVTVGLAGLGAMTSTPVSAAPSGTFPDSSDSALTKLRGDRLRLVERSSAPPAPSSGRVVFYTEGSDL